MREWRLPMQQDAIVDRRFVLKGAAVAGVAAVVGGACLEPRNAEAHEASEGVHCGFFVDTRRCVNCGECVEACRLHNHTPADLQARRKVTEYTSRFDVRRYVSTGCMHCADPACMAVCPAGAISKRDNGVVVVDSDRCIGCKYCFEACPFAVPHYGANGMDKCDCCLGAGVPEGEEPHCVQACMFGALNYAPVEEIVSNPKYEGAVQVQCETGPSYWLR